jgi:hypothetical protein
MKMKIYFEYRNFRGGITGWSDDFEVVNINEAEYRADCVMERIGEISKVIAHDSETDIILGWWGM